MTWEDIRPEDRADFSNLQAELLTLLNKEEAERDRFIADLTDSFKHGDELSDAEHSIYRRTYEGIEQAAAQLDSEFRDLRREIRNDPEDTAELVRRFTYSGIRVAPAVRRSVCLRTALTQHTPTLRGRPISPHPRQMYLGRVDSDSLTVDYLRAGCVFDAGGQSEETKRRPHPILDRQAEEVSEILFQTRPDISLSFNGAIGGIKTAREVMETACFESSRTIFLHPKSWMEITSDIEGMRSGLYEYVDETDGATLLELLQRDEAGGVIVEPILNHEDMVRMWVGDLLDGLTTVDRFEHPTYLLVDSVHVPEFDPFSRIGDELPENLCLINVISTVKYLQAGWDLTKGGVLSASVDAETFEGTPLQHLLRARENNGTGISYEEAALMTIETPESFRSRMDRYDRNVELVYAALSPAVRDGNFDLGFVEGSRLIYIDSDGAEPDRLKELHYSLIEQAKSQQVPLMDASSYGINSPHIHLGTHSEEGKVVRLSPGSTNYSTVKRLAALLTDVLKRVDDN